MPVAPPRAGTPAISLPNNPLTGSPPRVSGMRWSEAKRVAKAGFPVRRAAWRKWLIYDPAVFTWIISEPVVSGPPTRDPLRVVRTFDFSAQEFRSSDWTSEPWTDGDPAPSFPAGGPGPASGIAEPPAASTASPDTAVVRLELSLPLIDPEAVCLVAPGTTKLRAKVTIVGGPTAVGAVAFTLNGDSETEVEKPAWPGAEVVHDFVIDYTPGDEFEVQAVYSAGPVVETETLVIPAACIEVVLEFTGEMTETSTPPEEYEDADGYVREESYSFQARYQCATGAGTKTAKLLEVISPPALVTGVITPPGATYTRPIAPPGALSVTLNGDDEVTATVPAALGAFPPAVASAHFTRTVVEAITFVP